MGRSYVRNRRDADPGEHGLIPEDGDGPLALSALFGDRSAADAPLEIEIGSGKGTFLVAEAELRPDTLFLGIERARRYWLHAADRLRRREVGNARILLADAASALVRLPAGRARVVHVFFPDPWPKRRHAHRRLVRPDFLGAAARVLEGGGAIRIATDDEASFDRIAGEIERSDLFEPVAYEPPASARPGELTGSNFERKYRAGGRTIRAMAARRAPQVPPVPPVAPPAAEEPD